MKRLNGIDIARGIAIFFLVSMHVRYWPITRVYAMFDMALFFFISGYVFNGNKKVLPFVWGNVNTQGIWAFLHCALGIGIPLTLKLGFDKVKCLLVRNKVWMHGHLTEIN